MGLLIVLTSSVILLFCLAHSHDRIDILTCRSSGRTSGSSSKVKVIFQKSRSPGKRNFPQGHLSVNLLYFVDKVVIASLIPSSFFPCLAHLQFVTVSQCCVDPSLL